MGQEDRWGRRTGVTGGQVGQEDRCDRRTGGAGGQVGQEDRCDRRTGGAGGQVGQEDRCDRCGRCAAINTPAADIHQLLTSHKKSFELKLFIFS